MTEPNPTIERFRYFARVGGWFVGKARARWIKVLVGLGAHAGVIVLAYLGLRAAL